MQKKAKTDLYAAKAKRKTKLSESSGQRSYVPSHLANLYHFRSTLHGR